MRYLYIVVFLFFPAIGFGQAADLVTESTASMLPANFSGMPNAPEIVVLPETTQAVELNSTDFNRFQCPGVIQDVVVAKEKGVVAKFSGNNAFILFKHLIKDGKPIYAKNPVELNIVCDGDVYTIVAVPKNLAYSPVVRLSSGKKKKMEQNASVFGGMPIVKKCIHFVKLAYKGDLPNSFDVVHPNKPFDLFKKLKLVLSSLIIAEGEGLRLKIYVASNVTKDETLKLTEKDFLKTELTTNTLWISLGPPKFNLKPGESVRVFIIERTGGERE